MNAKTSGNVRDSKNGRAASSTKKPFNWMLVIIICVVLLLLIAGGVIAWFLLFAPKSPKIIKFFADPNSIEVGQFATLSWEIKNASMAEINQIGMVELSGEIQVQPTETTEYTLIGKNEKEKTETRTLTVKVEDMTAPIINIVHSPPSPNTEENVLFTAIAEDAGGISKVEIAVNGEVVKSCSSSPCSYEGGPYPLGEITYNGIGYDKSGNEGSTGSKTFTVNPSDVTPPSVDIKHSPESPNTEENVLFTAIAEDAGGISKVEIAVNGEVVKSCSSSPCTYEDGPYPLGSLNYSVYAYDNAGNKEWSGARSLEVIKTVIVFQKPIEIEPIETTPVKPIEIKPIEIAPVKPKETQTVRPKDTTPPSVAIKHSPASPNIKQKVAFIARAKDASGIRKVQLVVNGKIVKSCRSAPCTYEGGPYPLGTLKYGAYAYDKAGNRKWSGAKSLKVIKSIIVPKKPIEIKPKEIAPVKLKETQPVRPKDTTPPSVAIKHSPASPNIKQKVAFIARAKDEGGISKIDIAVNGRIVKSCKGALCTYEGGPYPLGTLEYGAYAYDKAGNKAYPGSNRLTISKPVLVPIKPMEIKPIEIAPVKPKETQPVRPKDTTPSSVTIMHSPTSPNIKQKVTFTARAKDASGIRKVQLVVNGKIVKSCRSAPCTYEGGPYPLGTLKYGAYTYDKAGNRKWSGAKSLKVIKSIIVPKKPIEIKPKEIAPVKPKKTQPVRPKDTTPPSVAIKHSPASPNTTQKITFAARATDAGGISKVEIAVNGKVMKSCTSTPCSYTGGPYPAGSLNYGAYAYDKAGNKSSTGSKSLRVSRSFLMPTKPITVRPKDTKPPSVGIRYSPESPNTTQKVFFTANAADAGGISKVDIAVNGKVVKSCTSTPCSYEGGPYPVGNVSYGAYAYDKAGNKASTGSKSLTVSKPVLMPIKRIPIQPIPRTIK